MTTEIAATMPFAQHCGFTVTSATREKVEGRLAWRPELGTTAGVMHGGALMAFADTLGAMCAFLNLPAGAMTTTIESKTNFFRPVTQGTVHGTTTPLHVGPAPALHGFVAADPPRPEPDPARR